MTNLKWLAKCQASNDDFCFNDIPWKTTSLGPDYKKLLDEKTEKKDLFLRNLTTPSFWSQQRLATSLLSWEAEG